jgi:hypothetical protein
VLDAGIQREVVYLVMELVRGCSLGERIDQKGRLPHDEVRRVALALADGLAAIHRQGIIHRDIKPDNVLLGEDGAVKITDLGLARQTDDESFKRLTVSGMVVGTPYYLAPEAIRDCRNAGPASDIYSFGATLYHCLAGQPPFDAPGAYDVMRKHLEERYRPLREFDRHTPRYLIDLVDCCLEKDPEKRPSADDCVQALKHGGRLGHEQRGLTFVAVILVGLLGATAAIAWQVLTNGPAPTVYDRASSERTASVSFAGDVGISLSFDGAAGQPWRAGAWYLAPGQHQVEAEQFRDGQRYVWQQVLDLAANDERSYAIDLQPCYLTSPYPVRVELGLPEGSSLFHRGENLGWRKELHFNCAGSWVIASWDGKTAARRSLTIYRDGSSQIGEWEPCPAPPPEAYLRSWFHDLPCPPHHIVSWWECELSRGNLSPPGGWERQLAHPEQPVLGLDGNTALIDALVAWRKGHGLRLPDRHQAEQLARAYGNGIWYREEGGYRVAGGGLPARALLALVGQ